MGESILTLDFFLKNRVSILVMHQIGRAGAPGFRRECFLTRARYAARRDVVAAARDAQNERRKKYTYPIFSV